MIRLKRILVSTDFSDAAAKALPYASSLAREYGAELHVVHVVEDSLYYAQFVYSGAPCDPEMVIGGLVEDRKKQLEALRASLPPELRVTTHLRRGVVADEIIATAAAVDVDLVVIATHGRTGFSHLFFGSVAERVVRLCPCPVLTVREKTHGILQMPAKPGG
ncbi:MAG: universal stress protein [Planctomycetota bacterium]|nr:universal stress protein [Planctomycetota bacterium]